MNWRSVKGRIHSIETCGLRDGPGVRVVVFFQGCPLRCVYCHNPDTWYPNEGIEVTAEEVVLRVVRYTSYMGKNGGVTFSGGEPLMQPAFLAAVLKGCKAYGIHTAIDTSGYGHLDDTAFQDLDLVILDLKAPTDDAYRLITGKSIKPVLRFMEQVELHHHTRVWIRHVQVPDLNDHVRIEALTRDLACQLSRVDRFEILNYHNHGVHKYKALNKPYLLEDKDERAKIKSSILDGLFVQNLNESFHVER